MFKKCIFKKIIPIICKTCKSSKCDFFDKCQCDKKDIKR